MNIVSKMLEVQNQVRIFHWQTYGYAEHEAFGNLYNNLSDYIDNFVEVFMGKYGRIIAQETFDISLQNYKNLKAVDYLNDFINYLSNDLPSMLNPQADTDLLNIRDEILANVNKTKYLLTLK